MFWPLGAFLAATFGWRNACFAYAALHLLIALPLVLTFPAGKAAVAGRCPRHGSAAAGARAA